MILNTDLTDWLIAVDDKKENLEQENLTGTGLLLAPVDFVQPEENNPVVEEEEKENINQNFSQDEVAEHEEILNSENENLNPEKIDESEKSEENYEPDNSELQKILIPENSEPENVNDENYETSSFSDEIYELQQTVQNLQDSLNNVNDVDESFNQQDNQNDNDENSLSDYTAQPPENDNKWQEAATGFELSLDEPPPEHWQHLNASPDYNYNYDDDDENEDYVRTTSLQGDAYIPKHEHGKNFTQRLKKTLKGRKDRAEAIREEEAKEKIHYHPYVSKAAMMCLSMLLTVALAWLALIFLQRETPDGLNKRAAALNETGDYEGAMNLYEKAYKRYPDVLTFLTGLADSAEKAGHVQTANVAWNEYMKALPKDDSERRKFAENNLKRLNGEKEIEIEKEKNNEKKPEEKPVEDNKIEQNENENKGEIQEFKEEIKTEIKTEEIRTENNLKTTEEPVRKTDRADKLEKFNTLPVRPVFFADVLREGNNAYNLGLYNSAVVNFHHALEIRCTDVRPYIGLAEAYRAKGMFFDAKRILDIARKKFPKNPTVDVELKILREAGLK